MIIKSIKLHNFRNYQEIEAEFSPQLNILHGRNAQGKTNLLEALFLLSVTRSHRTRHDRELIHFGEDHFRAEVFLEEGPKLAYAFAKGGNRLLTEDGVTVKALDFVGQLNTILFTPDDNWLLKGPPEARRRFFQMELSKIDKNFIEDLQQFKHILKQRNALLKQVNPGKMLAHYDAHFANFAAKVILGLRAFCGEMEKFAKEVFAELPGGDGKLRLRYSTIIPEEVDNLEEAEELLRNRLASDQDHDILQGVTHTGPHRDDFHLYIGDRSLRMYGSQGQVKSAVLALKLATMEVIRSKQGYYPVLLLDDITSELDAVRLNYFLEWILSRGQIFLTTTGLDNFSREMRGMAKIFKIVRGGVTVEKKADVDESLVDLPADAGVAESVENR